MRINTDTPFRRMVLTWDNDIEVGPGTEYPIKLTLEKMVKWWYRVKKWHVKVNLSEWTVTSTGGLGATAMAEGEDNTTETTKEFSLDEGDLIFTSYTNNGGGFVSNSEMEVDPSNRAMARIDLGVFFRFCIFTPSIVMRMESGQLYFYPYMDVVIQANQVGEAQANVADPVTEGLADMNQSWLLRSLEISGAPTVDITIDGETLTLYYPSAPSEFTYNVSGDGATIEASDQPIPTITIEPFEYWSYSGTWNTETGVKTT